MPSSDPTEIQTRVTTIRPVVIQNILETLPVGLVIINPQGDIIYANPSAHTILGTAPDDFATKGWGEIFFHPKDNIAFNQVVIDAIREKKVNLHKDVSYKNPSGKFLRLSMTTSLLQERGTIVSLIVLLSDLTDVYRVRKRERALLKERNRIQSERAESLRNLALSVAHQIRNPVTLIGGFAARVLNRAPPKDPNRTYMEKILEGTLRLETIVRAVRDYAEIHSPTRKRTDLAKLLETVRQRVEKKSSERSLHIQWRMHVQPASVRVDPHLLVQALEEILANSLESFSGAQGIIQLSLVKTRARVCIRLSDNGIGIPAEQLPYIVDPFFTTKAANTGMGLCKADRIIREHGGELVVTSEPGKGTVATIRLPTRPHPA